MDPVSVYSQFDIPAVSLLVATLVIIVTLPAALIIGYSTGKTQRQKLHASGEDAEPPVDDTTLSALLAILGLLLAFSFGNALSHAQDIKTSITDEAAALGTAFLRTDYLEEPKSTELKEALFAYAQTRVLPLDGSINSVAKAQEFMAITLEAQAKLWPLTVEATQNPIPPAIKALVVNGINDVLDAHLYRVQTMANPISDITRLMMLAASLVALFLLGNRTGLMGHKLTWRVHIFSVFLFLVMTTIMDTQRGGEGLVRVDDTSLRSTVLDMELALAAETQE